MFNWKKQTVHNAIIQLGDTDDSGKGRHFKSRFMKDGLVKVEKFGNVLIKKENLDKFIDTMVGVPVIINHKDITEDNADDERVGVVNSVWYNEEDGWFWCDGVIWDKTAQNLITDKGWSVSCSYDVKVANDEGGSENNIKYDIEFLDAVFTHLALVNNPRYERANIVFNSKTEFVKGKDEMEINNGWITKYDDDGNPYHVNIEGYNEESDQKDDKAEKSKFNKEFENLFLETQKLELEYLKNPNSETAKKYNDNKNKLMQNKDFAELLKKSNIAGLEPKQEEKKQDSKSGKKEDKKVSDTKIIEGGIKESTDKYGRTKFAKGNKWANVSSNGGRSDSWIAAYGLSHPSGVSWEREKGITEEQLLHSKGFKTEKGARKWALEQLKRISNEKEQAMEIIDKLKALIFSVENEKEYQMEVSNEKVDKRKLIDEVAGIMKSAGCDDEVIRTAIGKMEKIGYDKSEANTADNKKEDKVDNKCDVKNEDKKDEKEVKEVEEEVKEDVENCGKKGKVDNSKTDYFEKLEKIHNSVSSSIPEEPVYVSRADREKAADDYFRN